MSERQIRVDSDAQETQEWLDAMEGVIANEGTERATFLIDQQISYARTHGVHQPFAAQTPYINTIPVEQQPRIPGDQDIEQNPLIRALECHGDGSARQQRHQCRRPHRLISIRSDAV